VPNSDVPSVRGTVPDEAAYRRLLTLLFGQPPQPEKEPDAS
jgi:hypothetical protein